MKRIFFLILFFSNSILYSQFDDYEVLYASQYGYPFELRQVFLNEPDICDQTEHTQFTFYFKNVREQDKIDVAIINLNKRRDFDEFRGFMRRYSKEGKFIGEGEGWVYGQAQVLKENRQGLSRSDFRVVGKGYTMYIDTGYPNFLSIMTNKDFKLTRIHNSQVSEFARDMEYASNYWDNDKCEGGLLIDN